MDARKNVWQLFHDGSIFIQHYLYMLTMVVYQQLKCNAILHYCLSLVEVIHHAAAAHTGRSLTETVAVSLSERLAASAK